MIKPLLSCLTLVALCSCGYTFQGSGSILPADVKRIFIPMVENTTTEPALTLTLTEALRDRFERFGTISVVDSESEADAILNIRVVEVRGETSAVTSQTDTELQRDTQVIVSGELRRVSGPVLWRKSRITASETYGTTGSVVVTSSSDFAESAIGGADIRKLDSREVARGQKQEALANVAEQVALRVYNSAVAPDF